MTLERTLPREAYFADAIWRREKERIFGREWVCAGRLEALRSPGDYTVVELAGESILIVLARAGDARAFYNVCRHRGCRLVLDAPPTPHDGVTAPPSGHFSSGIRCPYHSWTYTLEGELRTAPFLDQGDGFTREDFPLWPVGIESWGGFYFLNLSPLEAAAEERTLFHQLGAVPERLRRYPLAELRTGPRIVYDVGANWKVMLENYNECYHCAGVHPELCKVVPAFRQRGGSELDWDRGIPHREGAWTFTHSGTTSRAPFAGLDDDEKTRHKGELIYPNFLLSLSADHVAAFTLWPRDPEHTTIACDFLFHPDEMAKPGFDPRDAVEFWDLVNRQDWRICEGVQAGMRARVFQHGYYAPMESWSLDIRRYIADRLGSG
jgi:phenylpropionate dioxygenase-like ring-hydroxylating dioxygenase large terminal subunit